MALKKFLTIGFVAAVLVACGDDSGNNPVNDSDEVSSSSVCEDCGVSSSSKAKSSSSSRLLDEYVDPSTVVKGTMTDERDGQTYKTVKIGTQTWMAENLNYAYTGVPYNYTINSSSYTSDSTSWCHDNDPAKCSKYGRFYTWAAAMDSVGTRSTNGKGCGFGPTCSPTYPVRGVCPEGWHLPDRTEWETLFAAVGGKTTAGKMLKSTSGRNSSGNGTDAYAFSALPAGRRDNYGDFRSEGRNADFWSSTEDSSGYAYGITLYYRYDSDSAGLDIDFKSNGFSVRCVKDE